LLQQYSTIITCFSDNQYKFVNDIHVYPRSRNINFIHNL